MPSVTRILPDTSSFNQKWSP